MPSDFIGSLALVSKSRFIWPEEAKLSKEISHSEIVEEAAYSLLSEVYSNKYDHEAFYCKLLGSRIINNQILHELVTSSPIIASYDKFPRLTDIQNEALFLASDPYASSKYVKFLVAALQSEIPEYVNRYMNNLNSMGTRALDCFLADFNYVNRRPRLILRKNGKKEKETRALEMNARGRS